MFSHLELSSSHSVFAASTPEAPIAGEVQPSGHDPPLPAEKHQTTVGLDWSDGFAAGPAHSPRSSSLSPGPSPTSLGSGLHTGAQPASLAGHHVT